MSLYGLFCFIISLIMLVVFFLSLPFLNKTNKEVQYLQALHDKKEKNKKN